MHTLTRNPRDIKENPNQPRSVRDPEAQRCLVESVRQFGVLQPVGILPDNTNIWGWGRVLAAIEAELKAIPVVVLDKPLSEGEHYLLSLTENIVRSQLTPAETLLGFEKALTLNPGWTQRQLAKSLGIPEATVSRHLAVGKDPTVREALLAGRISLGPAYECVKRDTPEERVRMLQKALSGATREELEAHGRKVRNGTKPAEGVKRIRIELASGVTVVFSGDSGLSLEMAIEAATDAGKELKKGQSQGLTAKTISKVSAERAKAGG